MPRQRRKHFVDEVVIARLGAIEPMFDRQTTGRHR
jgi:hypothetical protein